MGDVELDVAAALGAEAEASFQVLSIYRPTRTATARSSTPARGSRGRRAALPDRGGATVMPRGRDGDESALRCGEDGRGLQLRDGCVGRELPALRAFFTATGEPPISARSASAWRVRANHCSSGSRHSIEDRAPWRLWVGPMAIKVTGKTFSRVRHVGRHIPRSIKRVAVAWAPTWNTPLRSRHPMISSTWPASLRIVLARVGVGRDCRAPGGVRRSL